MFDPQSSPPGTASLPRTGGGEGQVVGAIGRVSQQGERKRQRSEGEGKGEDGVVIGRGECFRVWKNAV